MKGRLSASVMAMLSHLPEEQRAAGIRFLSSWTIRTNMDAHLAEVCSAVARIVHSENEHVPLKIGTVTRTAWLRGFANRDDAGTISTYMFTEVDYRGRRFSFAHVVKATQDERARKALARIGAHPVGFSLCAFIEVNGAVSGRTSDICAALSEFNPSCKACRNPISVGIWLARRHVLRDLSCVFRVNRRFCAGRTVWSISKVAQPITTTTTDDEFIL